VKKTIALIAKLTITLALLYFAVSRVNLGLVAARVQQMNPAWFVAALVILGVQYFLGALRWRSILRACGVTIPVRQAARYMFVSVFFSQVLPSTVGGDAARIWLVAQDGAGWSKAIYSVFIDRIIGVLALSTIVVVCIPASFALVDDRLVRAGLLGLGLLGVAVPIGLIALGSRQWRLLHRFALLRHVNTAANAAYGVFASGREASWVVILSFVIQGSTIVAAWFIAKSVGSPFDLADSVLLVPPVMLIATIPISVAGWGVRESAMVMAFSYAGLPRGDGLLVSALFGFATFALGVFGGLVWLIGAREQIQADVPTQLS
jgi:glycosyltransferase 2 family protein